jgi:cold shock CspA family protein
MRIQGQIKKILTAEGYGFIETKENMSVFLHKSQSIDFNALQVGSVVEFEVSDTPKGKSALYVREVKVSKITRVKEGMFFSRGAQPKQTKIVTFETVTTSMFRDPNLAKAKLENMAMAAGCNAILNMQCKRQEVRLARNYYGTVHTYTADIAIITEQVTVNEREKSTLQFEAFSELNRRETLANEARNKRLESLDKGNKTSLTEFGIGALMLSLLGILCLV